MKKEYTFKLYKKEIEFLKNLILKEIKEDQMRLKNTDIDGNVKGFFTKDFYLRHIEYEEQLLNKLKNRKKKDKVK